MSKAFAAVKRRLAPAVLACCAALLLSSCSVSRRAETLPVYTDAVEAYLEYDGPDSILHLSASEQRRNPGLSFSTAAILRTEKQGEELSLYIGYYLGVYQPDGTNLRESSRAAGAAGVKARQLADGIEITDFQQPTAETYDAFAADFQEKSEVNVDILLNDTAFLNDLKNINRERVKEFYHLPEDAHVGSR